MKQRQLKSATDKIKMSEEAKEKIIKNIKNSKCENGGIYMKSKKKITAIAFAAVLMLGITAIATGGIVKMRWGSSSSNPDYTTLPTHKQVVNDIGYDVILIDNFENGYEFENGSIVKNDFSDENGSSLEKFKSVDFRYKKDGDRVYFSQEKYVSETEKEGEVIATENGCDIYYYSYKNKLVPPDYKLTSEDKKAKENGELIFSYGSDKVEINEVQGVSWEKDGIHYLIMQIDGKLSKDELKNMATEILENK